ncbi:uncharacterized protein LY89DRAFT_7182 [Mollisia scopiformis]|uniref:Uncharacterized protein n=1 Tax=Mollisia scopiformis TaxID=149040 RepID=A0A194XUC3_MOLSC|nr:uncharacterized protein LY89DRAFT_7182 [Mollisia scopiformis]KUJ23920.1 hypothetical protein LY89DRAFT_7182 [Mollisia scopiformis]
MCGSADNNPTPPPRRVITALLDSSSSQPRPRTSTRPSTSTGRHRPQSSRTGRDRPQSTHQRPSSSFARPSSSRRQKHAPKTSGGERHTSSYRDKSQFPLIPEYPEDRTIIRRITNLATLIDQHAEFYYPHNARIQGGDTELDNLETRHAAIRRHIARGIVASIIEEDSSDISEVANHIATQLADYADPNTEDARNAHIQELCKLGDELRVLIESHPSSWIFGSWADSELGFIVMFPAVSKDGDQVIARQIFRTG